MVVSPASAVEHAWANHEMDSVASQTGGAPCQCTTMGRCTQDQGRITQQPRRSAVCLRTPSPSRNPPAPPATTQPLGSLLNLRDVCASVETGTGAGAHLTAWVHLFTCFCSSLSLWPAILCIIESKQGLPVRFIMSGAWVVSAVCMVCVKCMWCMWCVCGCAGRWYAVLGVLLDTRLGTKQSCSHRCR